MLNGKVRSSISMMAEKSTAVPFLDAPCHLKSLPGYKSFDPLGFSSQLPVAWLQEAGKSTSYHHVIIHLKQCNSNLYNIIY